MKKLLLLRGAMGAGKSTFIKEKGLEPYTLSPDTFRLMIESPCLNEDGTFGISQLNSKKAWKLLFEMTEHRMKNGDFIIIDATHTLTKEIGRYKDLANKYRYRTYVIDFTKIPEEIALKQNKLRVDYKIVGEEFIKRAYERFETEQVPGFATVIPYEEADSVINITPLDFSKYKKVHHIGDIHGCFSPLYEYLKDGIKDDELYIFLGDFIDRGIENAKTLNFLIEIMNKENVILLEGNHEIHLWNWSNNERSRSKVFETETKIELEENSVKKKDIRMLYRKLRNLAYYTYNDKKVLVTHGGLSTLPDNLNFISSKQIIKGVGDYSTDIDEMFCRNVKEENVYQIHGHRNSFYKDINSNNKSFNLVENIEIGGNLRILTLDKEGFTPVKIKNTVFKIPEHEEMVKDTETFLEKLRNDESIGEKVFGNISSFNFKREVFFNGSWDLKNIKARGVFINTKTIDIVARGYEKFFNIEERAETTLENLKNKMRFPVIAYVKENGYLGLVGIDAETFEFVFASKSSINSEHAKWLKEQFYNIINTEAKINKLKKYMIKNNVSFTFEVVEPINDPHIIDYEGRELILLDIIKRSPRFDKEPYRDMVKVAKEYGFKFKKIGATFNNWEKFIHWYEGVSKEDFKFNNQYVEGFVIEDSNGDMVKIKLHYYKLWKYLRSLKERIEKGKGIKTNHIKDKTTTDFIEFIIKLSDEDKNRDIIELRKMFYQAL